MTVSLLLRLSKVLKLIYTERRPVGLLLVTMAACLSPALVSVCTQESRIDFKESYAWQRVCTMHSILCCFYLLDLTFDVVVTGLHNSKFVIFNIAFYLLEFAAAIISRVYYRNGTIAVIVSLVQNLYVIWFLDVVLLHHCSASIWTLPRRWLCFALAAMHIFMNSCLVLFRPNLGLILVTGVILLSGVVSFGVYCVRTALVVESSSLNGCLSVDEKRSILVIICIILYYASALYAFVGDAVLFYEDQHYPDMRTMKVYRFIHLGIAVVVSYIPWRVSTRSFIENRRRLDSKLDFISKMSFAIRQRFGILSGGAENFLHELEESTTEGATDMVNTMKDVMESCSISKSVLDDFSICESIINGEVTLAARDTTLFVVLKDILIKFYSLHVSCVPINVDCRKHVFTKFVCLLHKLAIRVFSREPESSLSVFNVRVEPIVFSRVMEILLSAALEAPKANTVSPPITIDLKCVLKDDGQMVGQPKDKGIGMFERFEESIGSVETLFLRIEISGGNVKRGTFEFFDENSLDEASVFVPAYDKESGLGFWICREFIKSMGGGIGIVTFDESDYMDEENRASPQVETPSDRQSPLEKIQTPNESKASSPVTGLSRCSSTVPVTTSEQSCCLILDLPLVQDGKCAEFRQRFAAIAASDAAKTNSGMFKVLDRLKIKAKSWQVFPIEENTPGILPAVVDEDPNNSQKSVPIPPSPEQSSPVSAPHSAVLLSENEQFKDDCNIEAPRKISEPPPVEDLSPQELPPMIRDLKILLVDDSKAILKVFGKMLRSRPQIVRLVVEAEDGIEGVEKCQQAEDSGEPFDLVLIDYVMPGFNGPSSVQLMRTSGFKGIVIGITGMTSIATIETFIHHGADRVLSKPVSFNTLYETVRDVQLERIANLRLP